MLWNESLKTTKDGHIRNFSFHDNVIKKGGGFEEFNRD